MPMDGSLPQLQLLDEQRVYCYGAHCVKYQLKDTWEQFKDCEHTFYTVNKISPALILSLPALMAECVHIDCSAKDWHFKVKKPSLEIQTPEEFA